MATRMQQRRGTADQWLTADPVLDVGEIGFETDTNSFKIGDGVNSWVLLDYFTNESGLSASLDDYILATEKATANGVATLDADGFVPAEQLDIDLTAYYTSAEVDAEIAAIPAVDLTGYATETYADTAAATAAAAVVDAAPGTLDTLNELAAALGDDANFATTVTDSIAGKAALLHNHSISEVTNLQTELDAKTPLIQPISSTKTSNYILQLTDAGLLIRASGNIKIIIEPGSLMPGQRVDIVNVGTGTIEIEGFEVTIISKNNNTNLSGTGSAASLVATTFFEAILIGDLS